jgi:hypothetical protein
VRYEDLSQLILGRCAEIRWCSTGDSRCYTEAVPTTLPRTTITHTPDIRRALDIAAIKWPGQGERELLISLALKGARDIEAEANSERQQLLAAAGSMAGVFAPDHRSQLRDEWPS